MNSIAKTSPCAPLVSCLSLLTKSCRRVTYPSARTPRGWWCKPC
jgi:hypothetical protein